ncbi:hypothetical protein HDV06_006654 [Boothiomyces sp. JEL0866]|nr:hypothetical protein HDV06_006654 [Boothiomyces sp. JEL0866]
MKSKRKAFVAAESKLTNISSDSDSETSRTLKFQEDEETIQSLQSQLDHANRIIADISWTQTMDRNYIHQLQQTLNESHLKLNEIINAQNAEIMDLRDQLHYLHMENYNLKQQLYPQKEE